MAYFDEHPRLFRFLFGILLFYLSGLAINTFYRYASAPNDENWFNNSPSRYCISKSFAGERLYALNLRNTAQSSANAHDSIRVGDLLLSVNGANTSADSLSGIYRFLQNVPADSSVTVNVLRPQEKEVQTYRVQQTAVPDSFLRVISPAALVTEVFKNGASDRAGMRVGDLIFSVNGKLLKNYRSAAHEADTILRSGQAGKNLTYDVLRDNRVVKLHVKLAKFGITFPLLIICLCGVAYIGTGAFIALRQPQIKAARLLGLSFLFMGFFAAVFLMQREGAPDAFSLWRNATLALSLFAGIAVSIHSGYYFPKERPELLARPWILRGLYGLATLMFLGAAFVPLHRFIIFGTLALLLYSAYIHFNFRKELSAEYKQLNRVVKWTGYFAGIIILGMMLVIYYVLKLNSLADAGYIGIPLIFIPLAYLYTIGRYHLLEMDLRVRRNVQYSIISLLWWILVIKLAVFSFIMLPKLELPLPNFHFTGGMIEILDEPMLPEEREPLEKGILMCLAIILSAIFWKLGKTGQRQLDKKYHRTEYDYRRAASEMADVMATKLEMVDIARGMVQKLYQLMYLKRVGVLFFRNQKTCCCREAYGFNEEGWEELCIAIDQKLIEVLHNFRSESRLSVDYLPNGLKQTLDQRGFRHVIPIRSKARLVGAMLIGEKRSEIPFCQEDFDFLTAAAKQASVAVENAFLYEELAEQERLKHELEIARRIQLASLPQTTPKVNGLDIAGVSIPALEVGGDYFDYLNGVPDEIRVIIGDVSGKGTSAALYMSKVQGIMRSLHGFGLSPKELFVRANHLLCQDMERKSFVTSLGADFVSSTRQMILARAGHLPLFYYHAQTRHVEKMTPKGLGLGLDNHGLFATELEERTVQYEAGDIFLFVTDGVTEAQSNGRGEFGEESVTQILAKNSALNAAQIRDHVINAVKQFAGDNTQHDDLTVVVVKATK